MAAYSRSRSTTRMGVSGIDIGDVANPVAEFGEVEKSPTDALLDRDFDRSGK